MSGGVSNDNNRAWLCGFAARRELTMHPEEVA
jgi:hypothetical protein